MGGGGSVTAPIVSSATRADIQKINNEPEQTQHTLALVSQGLRWKEGEREAGGGARGGARGGGVRGEG